MWPHSYCLAHMFFQQTFMEYLLCTRHSSRHGSYSGEQREKKKKSCLTGNLRLNRENRTFTSKSRILQRAR